MKLVSDGSIFFLACLTYAIYDVIKRVEYILASLEANLISLPPYVFDVDHVAKIRSELYITVLDIKKKIIAKK